MPDGKSIMEIAGDITIAMLEQTGLKSQAVGEDSKATAERVGEVYRIIYKSVQRPLETSGDEVRFGVT